MNGALDPQPHRLRTPLGFAFAATLFYVVDGAIVHSEIFARRPDLFTAAASFDLTIGVTLAYWLLVVRPGHAAVRTMLPVFLASVGTAALVLPSGHRDFVRDIRYLGIPAEIAVLGLIALGVRRARRRLAEAGVELDLPERIRALLSQPGVPDRITGIVATEFSILYYALAAWRRAPFVPTHARAFSYHRKNALLAILYTLLATAIIELAALDLLLRARHHVAANVFLVVDAFAVLWILGFARAVQLRPILVTDDGLLIRGGVQWSLDVTRSAIETVAIGRVKVPGKRTPGYLRATMGQPNVLITLKHSLVATGAYGTTRTVTRVGFCVDDPNAFSLALAPASA
jgi:hypothetical protein